MQSCVLAAVCTVYKSAGHIDLTVRFSDLKELHVIN
jgi:hypothetical protein